MKEKIRNYFISGLIVLVPIVVTGFLVFFIVGKIGGIWGFIFRSIPYVRDIPSGVVNFIGLFISIGIIILFGYIGQNYLGKILFPIFEKLLMSMPIIRDIYTPAREITNTLFKNKASFEKVVYVEFLHKDQHTIAFVTSTDSWKINGNEAVTLFVPTSPNPTSGFFCVVPKDKVIETDLSVEDALKIIVSSGLIIPKSGNIDDRKN